MLYRVPRLKRVASLVFYKGENAYFLTFFSRKCANVIQCHQNLFYSKRHCKVEGISLNSMGKIARGVKKKLIYHDVWQLLLYFYREFSSKILSVRTTYLSIHLSFYSLWEMPATNKASQVK